MQGLKDQLKEKNKLTCALQADKQSYLAAAAEEPSKGEYGKMNRGERKHNAMPHKPLLTRGKAATKDEKSGIKMRGCFCHRVHIDHGESQRDEHESRASRGSGPKAAREARSYLPQDVGIDRGSGVARDQSWEVNENEDCGIFP